MDSIQHSFAGYLMAFVFFSNIYLILICILLGAIPDLMGWLEKVVYHDPKAWSWYAKIHYEWWPLWFIPPIGLHVFLDRLTHGPGKRWWVWKERLWLEILAWLILIVIWRLL